MGRGPLGQGLQALGTQLEGQAGPSSARPACRAQEAPGWGAVGTNGLDSRQPGPRHGDTGPRLPQRRNPAKTGGQEPYTWGSLTVQSGLGSEQTQGHWPVVTEGQSSPGDPGTGTLALPLTMSLPLPPHRPQAQAQSQVTAPTASLPTATRQSPCLTQPGTWASRTLLGAHGQDPDGHRSHPAWWPPGPPARPRLRSTFSSPCPRLHAHGAQGARWLCPQAASKLSPTSW